MSSQWGNVISLAVLPPRSKARIVDIVAGYGMKMRLLQMGFTPGTEVEVIDNRGGHVLVRVRGVMVSLSRGMAMKILVTPL